MSEILAVLWVMLLMQENMKQPLMHLKPLVIVTERQERQLLARLMLKVLVVLQLKEQVQRWEEPLETVVLVTMLEVMEHQELPVKETYLHLVHLKEILEHHKAQGLEEAAAMLAQAAETLASQKQALQLRYLQTLKEVAGEKTNTIIFPLPLDLIKPLMDFSEAVRKDS